jgi:hypothetical protein
MNRLEKRLARERHTMAKMVELYCDARHEHTDTGLCADCQRFLDYAEVRLQK